MSTLQQTIESAWERRAELSPATAPREVHDAVAAVIADLDAGRLRVAEKRGGEWVTHQWLKMAVLLSFRLAENAPIGLAAAEAPFRFYDKIPTKFAQFDQQAFAGQACGSCRWRDEGAYIAPNVVLMPSYVAHRRLCRLAEPWSIPGLPWARARRSGANVHLSGGVGIGGVLEPLQNQPTDHRRTTASSGRARRSSKALIVEGELGAGHGRFHRQSTRSTTGRPARSGTAAFPPGRSSSPDAALVRGDCALYCAVIVKQVDARPGPRPASTSCCARDAR
jgi:2,3,4,5-tetrahydropyridine-2-carboxylate N-succinyltransferase